MKDRYLVTGATGFIGANLTRELVKRGYNVSILTRTKGLSWRLSDVYPRLHVYHCSLLNRGLEDVVDSVKPTVIYHFAAYGVNPWETDAEQMIATNITGTYRLMTAAKKHHFRLFVNTGTSSEYGVKNRAMRETDVLEPVNDYGATKSAATQLVTRFAKRDNLPIVTFRPFSPYGYYEHKNRLFPSVILSALADAPIKVSTPTHVRDFIFIEDVIRAYIDVTNKKCLPGEIINIGMGREHLVGDVVKGIVKASHSRSNILWGTVDDQGRQVEPARWQADIRKAKKLLGWEPRVLWMQGINKTVDWFKTHKKLYE